MRTSHKSTFRLQYTCRAETRDGIARVSIKITIAGPGDAITNLRATVRDHKTARFVWRQPTLINSFLTVRHVHKLLYVPLFQEYTLYYQVVDGDNVSTIEHIEHTGDEMDVTLDVFEANTAYNVWIQAHDHQGAGPNSTSVVVRFPKEGNAWSNGSFSR